MSHIATTWAWQQDVGNPVRKLILLHIADSASEHNNWQTWYSLNKIAERCNCSRGSVRSHLLALSDMGILTLTEQSTRQGRPAKYKINIGQIVIPGGAGDVPEVVQEVYQGGATDIQGGTGDVPEVVQEMYGGGTRDVPKTVIEPVTEPVTEPVIQTTAKSKNNKFAPPDWIPSEKWAAYLVSRKEKNHPMNTHALSLTASKIKKVIDAGIPVDVIMDCMIEAGWRGCNIQWFDNLNTTTSQNTNRTESNSDVAARVIAKRKAERMETVISEQ